MIISILFTSYNRHALLIKTIKYIDQLCANNPYKKSIEIFVSNANSKIKFKKIVTKNCKIKIYNHLKNINEYNNIRFLILRASGNYLYFLSDDDSIDNRFLDFFCRFLYTKRDIDIIYFNHEKCELSKLCVNSLEDKVIKHKFLTPSSFLKTNYARKLLGFSALYNRELLKKIFIKNFSPFTTIAIVLEQAFFIYLLYSRKILFVNYSFARIGLSKNSFSMLDINNTNYLKPSLRLIKFIDNNFFNSKKKMQLINNIENKNFEILLSRLFYNSFLLLYF